MFDLVVIGAGGCGLTAALVAAESGAQVLLLEKTSEPGGGTALSHRALRAAGSRFQREAGIEDTPARYAEEIIERSGGQADPELVKALTEVSGRMIEFLADVADVDFYLDDFTFGQSAARSHKWRSPRPITEILFDAVDTRAGVEIRFATPVQSLMVDRDAVLGVRTARDDVDARKVILATGGFGANQQMLERYLPFAVGVAFPGHHGSTGDGIEMGLGLGAAIRHMDSFQPYPAHVGPGKRGVPPGVILSGGIVVDRAGTRFVDETLYPGGLARAILRLPDKKAYEIFDEVIFEMHRDMTGERSIAEMRKLGDLKTSATVKELAEALGVDPHGLVQTIDDYSAAAGGHDVFGRSVSRSLEPPFHGIGVEVALYHTQGGLAVDDHGRVLRRSGGTVPNLYAGGGAAAGVSGDGMDGYLPGNGLLASLGLGMICAEHAVAAIREEGS